jgi:hypothetical protein
VITPFNPRLPLVVVESFTSGDSVNSIKRLQQARHRGHALRLACRDELVLLFHLFGHYSSHALEEKGAESDFVWNHRLSDLDPFLGIGERPGEGSHDA